MLTIHERMAQRRYAVGDPLLMPNDTVLKRIRGPVCYKTSTTLITTHSGKIPPARGRFRSIALIFIHPHQRMRPARRHPRPLQSTLQSPLSISVLAQVIRHWSSVLVSILELSLVPHPSFVQRAERAICIF